MITPTSQDRFLAQQISDHLLIGTNHARQEAMAQLIAAHTFGERFEASAEVTRDYEEVLTDHRRFAREIDVIMNGEEGAAKQASLCDLVAQIRDWADALAKYEEAYVENCYECLAEWELEQANIEMARVAEEERGITSESATD